MDSKLIEILIYTYIGGFLVGIVSPINNSILPKAYNIKESSTAGWLAVYAMVLLWSIPFTITIIRKIFVAVFRSIKGVPAFLLNVCSLLKNSVIGCK